MDSKSSEWMEMVTVLGLDENERFRLLAESIYPGGLKSHDSDERPEDTGRSVYKTIMAQFRSKICASDKVKTFAHAPTEDHRVICALAIADLIASAFSKPTAVMVSAQIVCSGIRIYCQEEWS